MRLCCRRGSPMPARETPCQLKRSASLRTSGSIWPGISGICKGAVLLARFHVPLSFLYDLTGDAHALVLHLDTTPHLTGWMLPSYIHYDPEASASYLEQALGGQFISDDRREEA
jgi:hypothetical protein